MTAPTNFGPYQVLNHLGAGGMGQVYLAHDSRLHRRVVIKVLPTGVTADEPMRERLRREARAAAALDHPFICKVFELGEHQGELYLVMEFVEGETLHQRMRSVQLPASEVLRIALQVVDALELAHLHSFVHRDLKPANIMLTRQGYVKVMDFGLAKKIDAATPDSDDTETFDGPPCTARGALVGTPDYMSPEQVKGLQLDTRSDLFSLGVMLLEMLSGKHPFRRPSLVETMSAILNDQPDMSGDLSQGMMVLLRRLLAKEPAERCPSVVDVREDLQRLITAAGSADQQRSKPDAVPLIGRDAEWKELSKFLEEAMAGRGSLVMIGGEPGIGKTHLITALLDDARRRGAYANIGHCYEMEGSPPYIPFIEMLEHSIRTVPREAFRYALGDVAPEVAKLAPELRRVFPDLPPALELPPEQQRRFLFNAYREFIERAARVTPLVAVLEDLHWADEPTLLLLQHIALSAATIPLLIIGTYRDVELDVLRPFAKTLESVLRQKQATRMPLRRFPLAGVERMLAALSGRVPPPSLAQAVFNETEGNPFFVEEVFRHLAEEGKLFDDNGAFRSDLRVDQLQVPEGVRLVLGRRLERLSEDARRVLTTAAVIGRVFSLQLLEALETARADAALDAMEEAERAHLVAAEAGGRETRYKFVHELVRQTLAERLSLPRRQRLHARVAEVMEKQYATAIESHIPALAHHLFQAGAAVDPHKTVHFLAEAARLASAAAAHEEALLHVENALSLLEGERTIGVGDLHVQRGEILRSLRREQDAVRAYVQALELFELLGDDVRFVQTGVPLSMILSWFLRLEDLLDLLARMKARIGKATTDMRCIVLVVNASAYSLLGEVDRAIELHQQWERIPEEQLSPRTLCLAVQSRAHNHVHSGASHLSEQYGRRAQSLCRQTGDLWCESEVDYTIVAGLIGQGRFEEAARFAQKAIQRAVRIGTKTPSGYARHGFSRLVDAAHAGPPVVCIPGPDRAMMYILAAWTGYRKGEIGSLTKRSLRLDDDPPTVTVAAAYSKRKRADTQVLHPDVVARLRTWLATKKDLVQDQSLFPISAKVPGGTERRTAVMMRADLKAARKKWIDEGETDEEKRRRDESGVLTYRDENGLYADFHANRHTFITNLSRAGVKPRTAQALARHSDIRLTMGVYTHIGLADQAVAIQALPAPPKVDGASIDRNVSGAEAV